LDLRIVGQIGDQKLQRFFALADFVLDLKKPAPCAGADDAD
jgi:hypothetical protein